MRVSSVVAVLASLACAAGLSPRSEFENVQVVVAHDLSGSYVRQTIDVTVRNKSPEPQQYYYMVLPEASIGSLSVLECAVDGTPQNVEPVKPTAGFSESGEYRISLGSVIQPGQELALHIVMVLTNQLWPLPESASQLDQQWLVYEAPSHFYSPYKTLQSTTGLVAIADWELLDSIESGAVSKTVTDSKGRASAAQGPVEMSAVRSIEPLADPFADPVLVRFHQPRALAKVTRLQRQAWVSHWGGVVSFDETYWLRNVGTAIKSFSRIDLMKPGVGSSQDSLNTAAVRELAFVLPTDAREAYVTDLVGNVSTSNLRPGDGDKRPTVLFVRPRYPVMGGWAYNFTVGWTSDLSRYSRVLVDESDRYLLRIPIVEGPPEVSYDEVEVQIVLPEGATDIDVLALFGAQRQDSVTHSFLDSRGRPTVSLTYDNVLDTHRLGSIYVQYTLTPASSLWKPLTIASGMLALFVSVLVLGKVDISLK